MSLFQVVDARAHGFVEQFLRNSKLFNCGTATEMQALNLHDGSAVHRVKMKVCCYRENGDKTDPPRGYRWPTADERAEGAAWGRGESGVTHGQGSVTPGTGRGRLQLLIVHRFPLEKATFTHLSAL